LIRGREYPFQKFKNKNKNNYNSKIFYFYWKGCLHFYISISILFVYIIMNKTEIKKLAIKKLNSKPVKNYKKQKKDCINSFDKSFIQSFIRSYQATH
jgi:hypothetical protein